MMNGAEADALRALAETHATAIRRFVVHLHYGLRALRLVLQEKGVTR